MEILPTHLERDRKREKKERDREKSSPWRIELDKDILGRIVDNLLEVLANQNLDVIINEGERERE